jgi:hypothetical protein
VFRNYLAHLVLLAPDAGGGAPPEEGEESTDSAPADTAPDVGASVDAGAAEVADAGVETVGATEGATVIPEPPGEADPGTVPTEGAETPEGEAVEAAAPPEWNGEMSTFDESFPTVDPAYRAAIKAKMKELKKGMERAFTEKTTTLADERKTFEAGQVEQKLRMEKLTRENEHFRRHIGGGEDLHSQAFREAGELREQVQTLTAELASAKEMSEADLAKAGTEAETLEARIRKEMTTESGTALSELQTQLEQVQTERDTLVQESYHRVRENLVAHLEAEAPRIFDKDDDGKFKHVPAAKLYESLIRESEEGFTKEDALRAVVAIYPDIATPKAEDVPDSIDLMSTATGSSFDTTGEKKPPADAVAVYRATEAALREKARIAEETTTW